MREPRREEEGGQTGRGSRSRMRMPWEKSQQQRADPDHQVTTESQEEGNTSAVLGMAGQCQE